jgi:GlpG protein
MRLIGQLENEASARVFGDFLAGQDISNHVEEDLDGGWSVWVESEDQIASGLEWLQRFKGNPKDPQFARGAAKAEVLRKQEQVEQEAYLRRVRTADSLWQRSSRLGPLTAALMGICIFVSIYEAFYGEAHLDALMISLFPRRLQFLPEVRSGEVWRLVTPIFVHASLKSDLFHILFNMLWLKDLGSIIEVRQGAPRLAWVVLLTAVISNLTQYVFSGPWFCGMSGVIYGLFGYIWMKSRRDPGSGLSIDSTSATIMMAWFFLCFSGLMGSVANGAHAGGLLAGVALGWLPRRASAQ